MTSTQKGKHMITHAICQTLGYHRPGEQGQRCAVDEAHIARGQAMRKIARGEHVERPLPECVYQFCTMRHTHHEGKCIEDRSLYARR